MKVDDAIQLVVILLVIVVPGVLQVIGKIRRQNQPGPGPQKPRPPQAPRPAQKPLEEEIGEFLRRAAEGRRAAERGRPAEQRRPRSAAPRSPARERPVEAQVVAPTSQQSVSQHVAQQFGGTEFQQRAAGLGAGVSQADEMMDHRLQDVFQHELGQLGTQTSEAAALAAGSGVVSSATGSGSPLTAELLQMLAHPESVRQAVVLGEILHRPEHRWS